MIRSGISDDGRRLVKVSSWRRPALVGVLLCTGWLVSAASTAPSTNYVYGTKDHLPVRVDGKRFITPPYGEVKKILRVAEITRLHGDVARVQSSGVHVPYKWRNRVVKRYTLSIPSARGTLEFSLYEGHKFKALGMKSGDKVVLDVLEGEGPFTGPRLWGPYDQIINSQLSMRFLIGNAKDDGFGLMKTSYNVGAVVDIPLDLAKEYGDAYSQGIDSAVASIDSGSFQPPERDATESDRRLAKSSKSGLMPMTWTPRRKAEIILAIWEKRLSRESVIERYKLSGKILDAWMSTAKRGVVTAFESRG